MKITTSELKDMLEKAHMAGQFDGCGIDASYSDAFRYADVTLDEMQLVDDAPDADGEAELGERLCAEIREITRKLEKLRR